MAVLLVFELTTYHNEVREELLKKGFLNSMVGYHTSIPGERIQSDLPSTLLFHPEYDCTLALGDLRETASSYGVHIDDMKQRAFAIGVEPKGAVDWRGVISRLHPEDRL